MSDSLSLKKEIFAGIIIMKVGVNIETNCQALTRCMNVSYVVCHKGPASLFDAVYRVCSSSTDILMRIC
jgi:hypothetical protein